MAAPNPNDDIRRQAQETASIVEDALRSIASQIGDIFEQTLSGADTVIQSTAKDLQSRFNKMAKITDDIASNITKLNSGTLESKNIQDQINKRKAQEVGLGIQLTTLLKQQNVAVSNIDELIEGHISKTLQLTDSQKELVEEYLKAKSINDDYIGQLEEQNSLVEEQKKKLGATGGILKGLTKIPVLGNLINAEKGLAAAQKEAAKSTSTKFSVLTKGIKGIGPSLSSALGPLALITAAVKAIQFFIEAMFEADQQVTDIAKSFNISKDAAREVRKEAFKISDNASVYAKTLGNQVLLQKEIVAANLKINDLLGVSIDLTNDLGERGKFLVAQFAAASKFLKLSEEEQKGLLNLTSTTGKEIDDINKTVLGTTRLFKLQSGVLLDERKVLKTVLESSNAIKLSTKGGLEGLTKSAIEASKLGLSLQKVSDIAGGLLDFESQIASELEAEVITGKDLNLELAQQAALQGDLATVASEVAKNIGSAAEYSKMNRLEQESLAKAVGMSREELADVLTTQENLNKLRSTYNTLGEDTINQLKKSGKLTSNQLQALDQIKAGKGSVADYFKSLQAAGMAQEDLIKLMGEQSYASLASQTAQEKFNESLEKAKELFSRFVDGGSLDKLADFITKFVASVAQKGLWNTLTGGVMSNEEILLEQKKQLERQKTNAATEEEKQKIDQQLIEVEKQLTQSTPTRQIEAAAKEKGIALSPEQQSKINKLQEEAKLYEEETSGLFGGFFTPQKQLDYKKALSEAAQAELDRLVTEIKSGGIKNLQSESYIKEKSAAEAIVIPQPAQGFNTGGIITKRIDNATIGEAGPEAIIPLESPIGREILNLDRKSTSNANMTIDNSQVIAAINRLIEVTMSNSNKEITLAMDGQTVGKVLTPIMATPITREINNTAVAT